ncbi:hypothetical protein PF010_g20290 [Phytophthora fragariae]|uniref:Aquaporin n=1 Tax=Phytophthora fragariae TaxID=53985 RepID=A0A6G0KFL2_9STRA|nr:hypothetical protein PF010_g20290 [Phytophthora fragariae]
MLAIAKAGNEMAENCSVECFAEFLVTFVVFVFQVGVKNQVTNSQDASKARTKRPSNFNGTWLSINTCWESSFSTYPSGNISSYTDFYTEVVGTTMLLLGIYATTDQRNRPVSPFSAAFVLCLMSMAIGMAFGMNTGYAINPARALGPRIFTVAAGWGSKVFTTRSYYFWISLVVDSLGGVRGGVLLSAFEGVVPGFDDVGGLVVLVAAACVWSVVPGVRGDCFVEGDPSKAKPTRV